MDDNSSKCFYDFIRSSELKLKESDFKFNLDDINVYMIVLRFFLSKKYNQKIKKECETIYKRLNNDVTILSVEYNINKDRFIYLILNDVNFWTENLLTVSVDISAKTPYLDKFLFNIIIYMDNYIDIFNKMIN